MDLINRYIYAVGKNFSGKQRTEIEMELRANIEDMVEQNEMDESYENKVKHVLSELGDPELIADGYRGAKRYLIGPKYFDTYKLVVKIVIAAVLGGLSVAMFVSAFFIADDSIVRLSINYVASLFNASLQAFAWTTIIFIIIERNDNKNTDEEIRENNWKVTDLPRLPEKKSQISLSGPIISIIFITVFYSFFIAMLYSSPDLLGIYNWTNGKMSIIPIFNTNVLFGYRNLLVIIFVLSILKELFKMYYRKWTIRLSVIYIILTIAATVLVLVILTNNNIWNPNLTQNFINYYNLDFGFGALWQNIRSAIVFIIVLANSIDIISALYKGIKYN